MYVCNLFHNAETDSIKRNINSNIFPKLQNVSLTVLNDNVVSLTVLNDNVVSLTVLNDNVVSFNSELVLDENNMFLNNSFIRT